MAVTVMAFASFITKRCWLLQRRDEERQKKGDRKAVQTLLHLQNVKSHLSVFVRLEGIGSVAHQEQSLFYYREELWFLS